MTYRLGIDVGGTNTDAAILDQTDRIIGSAKSPTTPDVTSGIRAALDSALSPLQLPPEAIRYAMLGTTHCTNAIVTRQGLNRVGVLRLGAPATHAVPPLLTWPQDLRQCVQLATSIVAGGYEYNGEPIADIDEDEIKACAQSFKDQASAVAVTGVFSPVNVEQERCVRDILLAELGPDVPVSLSNEIGSLSLIERENATVLNAALTRVAIAAIDGFERALREYGIFATTFLGQNDGSLMPIELARRYPIFTIASGPANSIRGAGALSGCTDAVIIDIGGTTTDVGVIRHGFPRESALAVEIGGVHTNFRMPDIESIGLGGGSRIQTAPDLRIGPDSVGYRLPQEALVFGGSTLTATDIAVAAGAADIGDTSACSAIPHQLREACLAQMKHQLEECVDRMKLSAEPVPVVVVGGGSLLCPSALSGAAALVRPSHAEVANAVGVALGQVSGSVDRVFALDKTPRSVALDEARQQAVEQAAAAGADPSSIRILDIEEIPLSYIPGNAVRLKVKAVGSLRPTVTTQQIPNA